MAYRSMSKIGLTAGPWTGHFPCTRDRLFAILECEASGEKSFSLAERALVTICEFWSAVESRQLTWHLGDDPAERLRYVAIVCRALGAAEAAQIVEAALHRLACARTSEQRKRCVAELAVNLQQTNDPVDALISRFARDVPARAQHWPVRHAQA